MTYLAVAMIAVWLLVTGYLVYIGQRQRQLEHELRTLEETVAEKRGA
jgi:CcmD family protein